MALVVNFWRLGNKSVRVGKEPNMRKIFVAALLLLWSGTAFAALTVSSWRVATTSRILFFCVADALIDLPATGVPDGAQCYVLGGGTYSNEGGTWTLVAGSGGVTDGDKGDITVSSSGSVWTVDADSVALGTDTTGGYAGSSTEGGAATSALAVTGFTASKCARFDGTGALVAASGDCAAGDTGGGGGDSITVNAGAATDPDFSDSDIDWILTGGNVITATVGCTDCVALGTETTGNYAAGDAEGGAATSGDSATSFFSSGTIDTARLGSGSASSATFLRGDQTWATPSGSTRLPAVSNPRASPDSADCEFTSGACASWAWTASAGTATPSSGTVAPGSTASGDPVYDTTSIAGTLLWQSDESVAETNALTSPTFTIGTDAVFLARLNATYAAGTATFSANNEADLCLSINNSGDSNEWVRLCISETDGADNTQVECMVSNNGTLTTNESNVTDAGAFSPIVMILKKTNNYHCALLSENGSMIFFGTAAAKTGVTTFDNVSIVFYTSDNSPRVIEGVDYFRFYPSDTFALVNP